MCWRKIFSVTPGESYTVQVGKGGLSCYDCPTIAINGQTSQRNGGESYFGSSKWCLAKGGTTDTTGPLKSLGGIFSYDSTDNAGNADFGPENCGGGKGGTAAQGRDGKTG